MKAMFEVIKHEGDVTNLVYKFEGEDFNTKSRLVVQQGQEAIFYYKGQIADRFAEQGTYVLDTQNIPILRHLVNLPFGKESPFHAVVYFVNTTEITNNKWGAREIPYIDPEYAIPLMTGISGEFNMKINDVNLLMQKLVGTLSEFSAEKFKEKLDSILQARVLTHMSNYYNDNYRDLFVLERYANEISNYLEPLIREDFLEFGVEITKFIVSRFAKHEDTPQYKRYYEFRTQQQALKDIELAEQRRLAEAEMANKIAIKQKEGDVTIQQMQQDTDARSIRTTAAAEQFRRETEGITSKEEHGFKVAEMAAQNEGAGSVASPMMGVMTGAAVMGATAQTVGGLYNDALSNINLGTNQPVAKQEQSQENDVFAGVDLGLGNDTTQETNKTVSAQSDAKASRRERFQELKELFEDGFITQEEYDAKRKAIIEEV